MSMAGGKSPGAYVAAQYRRSSSVAGSFSWGMKYSCNNIKTFVFVFLAKTENKNVAPLPDAGKRLLSTWRRQE
jgi:hypothetical protein